MQENVESLVKRILTIEKEEIRRKNKNCLQFYNTGE